MSGDTSTDVTAQVAEDLVGVLDYLSRVCTAADGGNAHYLWVKLGALELAVQRLRRRLCTRLPDGRRATAFDETLRIDGQRLRELVTQHGHHYRAGQALYPAGGSPAAAAARRALHDAATLLEVGVALDWLEGLTQQQANAIATWLRNQAPTNSGASHP